MKRSGIDIDLSVLIKFLANQNDVDEEADEVWTTDFLMDEVKNDQKNSILSLK